MTAAATPPAFVVVAGCYTTTAHPACTLCQSSDKITCWPGRFPKCWGCGAVLLYLGRVPEAPCVDGGGHITSHMKYVRRLRSGRFVCHFCGKGEKTS
jgi:hypothetical protein